MKIQYIVLAALISICTSNVMADSAQIVGVTTKAHSPAMTWCWQDADNVINGSGFDYINGTHGALPYNMWITEGDHNNDFIWWDLGGVYSVDSMKVWNHNYLMSGGNAGHSCTEVDIYVSMTQNPTEPTWIPVMPWEVEPIIIDGESWQLVLSTSLKPGTAAEGYNTPDILNLSNVMARHVLFVAKGALYGGKIKGLSEVRLYGQPFIKELTASVAAVSSEAAGTAAVNTVNNSGFNQTYGFHDSNRNNMWQAAGDPCTTDGKHPWIVWDLQTVKKVNHVKVWNYNVGPAINSANDVNIYTSTDNNAATANWVLAKSVSLNRSDVGADPWGTIYTTNYFIPTVVYLNDVQARLIKFVVKNSRLANNYDGDVSKQDGYGSGLSEVKFFELQSPSFCGDVGTVYLPLDFNHDCYINFGDLDEFVNNWLKCSDPAKSECVN